MYIFANNKKLFRLISEIREHVVKIRAVTFSEYNFHWLRNLAVSALSAMGVDAIRLSPMLGYTDTATVKQHLSLQRNSSSSITLHTSKKLLS